MPDKTALSVARCLVHFMGRYGRIEKLHSDLGQEFKAHFLEHLYDLWGMKKTTPYMPWSDGLVERANKSIQHLMKVYCHENIHVWDEYIWCVMQSYNSTVQVSTGCTPFMLMHLRILICYLTSYTPDAART